VFGKAPMNMFVSAPEYPPPDFKGVVRVNFDTLFSIAWLDLTKEPMIVSALDTCACRKSNPNILMMQSAQDRQAENTANRLDGARDGCILVQ
jgi:Protein of unknown function (DUF1254)